MGSMQHLGEANIRVRQTAPNARIPKGLPIMLGGTVDLTMGLIAWRTVSTRMLIAAPNLNRKIMSEQNTKTVRVRIAVAVDADGNWNACGWAKADDKDKMGLAVEPLSAGEKRYWLEADLALPTAELVAPVIVSA
jgi:hypothetical protein